MEELVRVEELVRMEQPVVLDHSRVVVRTVPIDLVVVDRHTLLAEAGSRHLAVRCNHVVVVGSLEVGSLEVDSLLEELGCIDEQFGYIGLPEDHNLAGESLRIC